MELTKSSLDYVDYCVKDNITSTEFQYFFLLRFRQIACPSSSSPLPGIIIVIINDIVHVASSSNIFLPSQSHSVYSRRFCKALLSQLFPIIVWFLMFRASNDFKKLTISSKNTGIVAQSKNYSKQQPTICICNQYNRQIQYTIPVSFDFILVSWHKKDDNIYYQPLANAFISTVVICLLLRIFLFFLTTFFVIFLFLFYPLLLIPLLPLHFLTTAFFTILVIYPYQLSWFYSIIVMIIPLPFCLCARFFPHPILSSLLASKEILFLLLPFSLHMFL